MTQTLIKTIADFSTTLVSKVAVGDTTATLTSGLDDDAVQLPTGTYGFTIDRNNSQKEHFTATLTGSSLTNIKHVTRGTGVASTGFANTHRKGAEVIISDHVAIKRMMDVLDGTTQFDSGTILGYDGTATATTPNQLITKAQLDAAALGTVSVNTVLVPGNAGEVVAAGNLVYLDVADGEWKLCDANTAATVDNIQLGIAQGAGTDGASISGGVIISGLDTHQTGLTNNATYYASDTAGLISDTPGSVEVTVGISRSTTSILFSPRYNQQLTEDQQDALVGTSGTPSASNKFVTSSDPALGVPAGTISPYAGFSAPTGWLVADGSAVSRTTYSSLFGVLTPTLGTFTITIAAPGVVTIVAHGLSTGDAIYMTTTGALPTGISVNTRYWITKVNADTFKLSSSLANALSSTNITTSGSQSGTHTMKRCPYGVGDGSTTFNLPSLKGSVAVGLDTTQTEFAGVGQSGGSKTHTLTEAELPAHTHTYGSQTYAVSNGGGTVGSAGNGGSQNTGSTGSGTAHNNLQPYVSLNYIIKY